MANARSIGGFLAISAFATAVGSVHCSSEDERPPPYVRPAVEDPQSCPELRAHGELAGTEIRIAGKRANCATDGLECTLEGIPAFADRCDGGAGSARCERTTWLFRCESGSDAGTDRGP